MPRRAFLILLGLLAGCATGPTRTGRVQVQVPVGPVEYSYPEF